MSNAFDAPLSVNAEYYRSQYADMLNLSPARVEMHFTTFGTAEGRVGAKGGLREKLLNLVPKRSGA